MEKNEVLEKIQKDVAEDKRWVEDKIQERRKENVGAIDQGTDDFAEETDEKMDALTQGHIFQGTFLGGTERRTGQLQVHIGLSMDRKSSRHAAFVSYRLHFLSITYGP